MDSSNGAHTNRFRVIAEAEKANGNVMRVTYEQGFKSGDDLLEEQTTMLPKLAELVMGRGAETAEALKD